MVLAQALSKGRRAEDAVRVACELGVDRIVPVIAERTQGRPDVRAANGLVERWRAVAVAALEQSRGAHLATIVDPVEGLERVPDARTGSRGLRLLAVPGAVSLPDVLSGMASVPEVVVMAVGPEGGWSPVEVARAEEDGWSPVGLGPTVLRTEHAGPIAVAVVAALLGRWRTSAE
jgi:16S rRNA (uracil1498-N3)-methyltransferase